MKKQNNIDFSIDISPLVDVLFTLLIFFSLTSTFVKESGIKIDLPEASSSTPVMSTEKYEIAISANGNISLNDIPVNSIAEVKEILSKFDSSMRLRYVMVIKADTATPHGKVTEVLDILKSMKFENIAVATRSKE
ncbi:MAG TPA: biopolymer transporter ExbD [bacterium]|nr:biopolymer transporter ExbD [bacterium]HPS29076.1 biopolymer transporter ExbD [bacterium]